MGTVCKSCGTIFASSTTVNIAVVFLMSKWHGTGLSNASFMYNCHTSLLTIHNLTAILDLSLKLSSQVVQQRNVSFPSLTSCCVCFCSKADNATEVCTQLFRSKPITTVLNLTPGRHLQVEILLKGLSLRILNINSKCHSCSE